MKITHQAILLLIVSVFYYSCQKEVQPGAGSDQAPGLGKDANGNCLPSTVNGIYIKDSSLNATHYIDVQFNVVATGSFITVTDTVNGIYFRDSSLLITTGLHTIRLKGFGKPVAAGVFTFKVKENTLTTCDLKVTVSPPGGVPVATFSLNGSPGACTAPGIHGSFVAGTPLDPSNKIDVSVTVTVPGSFTISIPTTNGISFTATGNFTATGAQVVSLSGLGMPVNAGITTLSVGTSPANCSFPLTILPGTGGGTSAFAIAGGSGGCDAGTSFLGKLVANTPLTSSDYMNVELLVASLGSYTIQTDTVNGIYFRKSGTFTTTGTQTISIPGFGTPVNTGSYTLDVKGGLSDCSTYAAFVGDGAIASAGEYFPITANSWWSYNSSVTSPDSLVKKSEVNSIINSLTYRRFYLGKLPVVMPYDSTHFRKSGQDLYEYIPIDSFIGPKFVNPQYGDVLLLKQDAPAGTYWESPIFTGTGYGGSALKVKYRFQVTNVNTTLVVNGKTYTNVIKVVWGGYVNRDNFGGYDQSFAAESYYAKGIGLIKYQMYPGYPNSSWNSEDLRNYQVF